jgi:hypothetical protein
MPYGTFEVPHGPNCQCAVCSASRVQNTERLTSTDRLAWLENRVIQLAAELAEIRKGNNSMGYALWCKTGSHSFDGDDKNAERMTIDERDENGKKTGNEITIHVCSRHIANTFKPQKKSLEQIRQEIEEATEIGD